MSKSLRLGNGVGLFAKDTGKRYLFGVAELKNRWMAVRGTLLPFPLLRRRRLLLLLLLLLLLASRMTNLS